MTRERDYQELYDRLLEEVSTLHRNNRRRIRVGMRMLLAVTLGLMLLMFLAGGNKVFTLMLWILSMFAVAAYLIAVEYADYELQKKLESITQMEQESLGTLLELPELPKVPRMGLLLRHGTREEQETPETEATAAEAAPARQEMAQLQKVLLSLKDVMNGADGLLTAASVTIADARGTVEDADAAAGSTVQLISTGLSAADTAYSDLLTVLNNTDKVLGDIEDALRSMDTSAADEALKADLHRKIQAAIDALKVQLEATEDEALKAQLETAIADLEALDALVDTLEPSALQGPVLDMLHQVRQELLAAAVQTNKEVNEYLHTTGAQAQTTLRSVQQLLGAVGGSLGEVSGTLDSYADAMTTVQPTLDAGITLANTVETYLADIEDDVRRVTESEAFKRFTELMESSDAESMADYLSSPVQLNTEIIYEIKDYGAAMSPYYVMLALFVGSLLTAVMLKVPVTQPEFAGCRAVERYFGRFLTFFLMAMAQALVTAFGCLYFVGMETAEPALFVLACCLCSLNFASMNYALVYALDNVGMALSVIIMVIQVAGSGGSYPVHVLPQLFQTLYPFMPFHYGMDMIRETVGGMYDDTYLRCALVLLGMCALFTVFGLLVYYPARRLNAAIAASKEKSGIM